MNVRLIKKKTIEHYAASHAQGRTSFETWLTLLKYCQWEEPGDISKSFRSADLLGRGSNRVVFDIGGNKFRVICKYQFAGTAVWLYVKWIGTHAEYTVLCRKNEQYSINAY